MVNGLGTIEPQRLLKIPNRFHSSHEFCFFLHDSMLNMFKELAKTNYPTIELNFEDEEEAARFHSSRDPIDYFFEIGRRDIVKELTVGQAMMAVWGDFFNFVYEALRALEKRKFVVALALLRKPLKENLLILTMMLVDEDGFFDGLETSPAASFGHPAIQDSHRKKYFDEAKKLIPFGDFIDPAYLHDLIYDVSLPTGFAPLFDKAMHLVTNRKQIKTEDLNLNFIFKDPQQNDVYAWIYKSLSYVLMYSILLQIELFRKTGADSDKLANWYSLTGLGSYDSLFIKGQSRTVNSMNRFLKPFLVCPHCDKPVKITKSSGAKFFITHTITCKHCGLDHDFPLFWLMSKSKWSVSNAGEAVEDSELR